MGDCGQLDECVFSKKILRHLFSEVIAFQIMIDIRNWKISELHWNKKWIIIYKYIQQEEWFLMCSDVLLKYENGETKIQDYPFYVWKKRKGRDIKYSINKQRI